MTDMDRKKIQAKNRAFLWVMIGLVLIFYFVTLIKG